MSRSISLNTNLASSQAQRQLSRSSAGLQRTFERLGSGMRIVRAVDDAAGLAVASTLSAEKVVYTQGIRNLNDGVSYLNIADSAVDQLKTIVLRCRELATQAANGTMTYVQRRALDQEAQALGSEYNRILSTTAFNGSKVFDAANANVGIQFGFSNNEAVTVKTGEGEITPGTIAASADSAGTLGTAGSAGAAITADGRFVAFHSVASNLVPGDSNGAADIFIKDLQEGTVRLVSTTSSGAQTTGALSGSSISADGRYVAFVSSSPALVAGDTNGQSDVFVKDLVTGEVKCASSDSSGVISSGGFNNTAAISADGRYVAFRSGATNLVAGDTNGRVDVFVKDLQTGQTLRVNTDSSGGEATGGLSGSTYLSMSADGRYVAFDSYATNLVAGDSNNQDDIFVKDLQTGQTRRVSTDSSGAQANNSSDNVSISADGRFVAFRSAATNLVAGDSNGRTDIFVKDLFTGETRIASVTSTGAASAGGDSSEPSISADGRFVAFSSDATNLVPGDSNAKTDVFVKDMLTGEIRRVSTDAAGGEASGGPSGSFLPAMSADGRVVAYESWTTNLVAGDSNAARDVFLTENTAVSSALGFNSVVRPFMGINLKFRATAQAAQTTLDDYLKELNIAAGHIGSGINRFAVALSVLGVRTENIAAAASRITDVDVADESSALTRLGILQQAASAVLAQANQQPAIALSFLRG